MYKQELKDPLATAKFFIEIKQDDKAKIVLDLLKPYARTIEQFDELGSLYVKCSDFESSLEIALKVYNSFSLLPKQKFVARINIIRGYLQVNKPEDALKFIKINLQETPDDPELRMEEAFTYFL